MLGNGNGIFTLQSVYCLRDRIVPNDSRNLGVVMRSKLLACASPFDSLELRWW